MRNLSVSIVIIVILFLILYYLNKEHIDDLVTKKNVCNEIDGRCYNVVDKYSDREKASELLAQLNLFCLKLMKHLRNKYIWNYHPNRHGREISEFLLSNYNPDGIIENAPSSSVNTSYVDDKGRVFAICLREKISGLNKFQNIRDLEFVVIHEMCHMATETYGHEKDFWTHFKFLLKEAEDAGLHKPEDYRADPMNYCSLMVDYNPYHDTQLRDIQIDYEGL